MNTDNYMESTENVACADILTVNFECTYTSTQCTVHTVVIGDCELTTVTCSRLVEFCVRQENIIFTCHGSGAS